MEALVVLDALPVADVPEVFGVFGAEFVVRFIRLPLRNSEDDGIVTL